MFMVENEDKNSWIVVIILTSNVREDDTDMFLLLDVVFLVLSKDKKACMMEFFDCIEALKLLTVFLSWKAF